MTAVAVKGSSGSPGQLFKQSETAGAKTVWLFHMALSADGTDGTGLVPVVTISKAGGAFGAAAGAVAELTGGWYKCTFTNVDLDTLGTLGIHVAVATADSINETARVVAFDPYDAVHMGLSALPNAAAAAAGGLLIVGSGAGGVNVDGSGNVPLSGTEVSTIQSGLSTAAAVAALASGGQHTVTETLANLTQTNLASPISMLNAITAVVQVSGTYNGATVKIETCEDPTAVSPVWTDQSSGGYSSGSHVLSVAGPHSAVRASQSGGGASTAIVVAVVLTFPN